MTTGMISIDEVGPTVVVRSTGIYDEPMIEAHAAALRRTLAHRRATGRPVRILIDLSGSVVQPPRIAASMAAAMRGVYEPADRVAVWCPSTLHAMQVRRVNADFERFVTASRAEAERFLLGANIKA